MLDTVEARLSFPKTCSSGSDCSCSLDPADFFEVAARVETNVAEGATLDSVRFTPFDLFEAFVMVEGVVFDRILRCPRAIELRLRI